MRRSIGDGFCTGIGLLRLTRNDRQRIISAIDRLKVKPSAGSMLKGEFSGLRRLRVGNHRVVYEVQNQQLIVLAIRVGHRREIYR